MLHRSVLVWIGNLCSGLRLSQRKTLAELVFGAMRCRRASLADIGRSLLTGALAKHSIKRVWRFPRKGPPRGSGAGVELRAAAAVERW